MSLTGRPIYAKGQKPVVSKPYRRAAMAATCTLMIPGICTGDTEKVVGCHLRLFAMAGGGQKPHDLFMVDACATCHAASEDRSRWDEIQLGFEDVLRALMQTQARRLANGLISVAGE